jgi:hypothetical protein
LGDVPPFHGQGHGSAKGDAATAAATLILRPPLKRLRDVCGLPESEPLWRAGRGFVVRDLPWTPFWTAVASAARHRFRTGGKSPDGMASACARKRRRRSRSAGALVSSICPAWQT